MTDPRSGGTGPQGDEEGAATGKGPGNQGPEDTSKLERVDSADERKRQRLRPQQPRTDRGNRRLDEAEEEGGVYFHVEGDEIVGHNAHGERLADAEYPSAEPENEEIDEDEDERPRRSRARR